MNYYPGEHDDWAQKRSQEMTDNYYDEPENHDNNNHGFSLLGAVYRNLHSTLSCSP